MPAERARGFGGRALWCVPLLLACLISPALAPAAAGAHPEQPALAPLAVIDGPSSSIQSLSEMSLARDGTGGLVYLKKVAGVGHVFVSRVVGGTFQAPEEVDAALPGSSSQPVIAAGNGGLLLVGFINGGKLYVINRARSSAPYSGPIALFAGASNPSLQMTQFGKAYLAFTAGGAGGHDVRTGYYYRGGWALESAPLDAAPGDNAGTGTGRPQVAAAGDGVAIVVWGEGGRIYSRRVWGTSPSVIVEQADAVTVPGCSELSADEPVVGSGGDSSYADVAFHEIVTCGGPPRSRVLMRRLRASAYEGLVQPDGLSGSPADSADQPDIAIGEFGRGFVTSARNASNQLFAMALGSNGAPGSVFRVDSLPNAAAPYAVPATAGTSALLIAWQRDPGIGGPEIRVRFSPGDALGPELVISSSDLGPTDAPSGLAAAGASNGDAAIAWIQGTAGSRDIVTRELLQPPGSFAATSSFRYVRTGRPVLSWSPVGQRLGLVRYVVTVDRAQVAQTTATSVRVPPAAIQRPLRNGPHTWQVTAVNGAGLSSTDRVARVFVDTIAPVVRMTVSGGGKARAVVRVNLRYSDTPRGVSRVNASGIARVIVKWGDRLSNRIGHRAAHAYRKPGRYRVTVIVTDRAGNSTKVVRSITVR